MLSLNSHTSLGMLMVVCALFVALLIVPNHRAAAAPHNGGGSNGMGVRSWHDYVSLIEPKLSMIDLRKKVESTCVHGSGIRDLCEQCTKMVRSEVVYPLCCAGKKNARQFCISYLNFIIEDTFK